MECNEGFIDRAEVAGLASARTFLVVDDDDEIRELLCDYLSENGDRVLAAASGSEMWQQLAREPVDLVVLDVMLPGEDGLSLCRQLQAKPGLSVIMLSAKGTAFDRIIGLEVGADDYLAKPFEPRELLARIKAVLRRSARADAVAEPRPKLPQTFAGYRLDPVKRMLTAADGTACTLPRSDFRVLRELLAAPDQVLTREHLTRSAMGRDYTADDRSIDMCISRLRQLLKAAPQGEVQILTVRNEGYLLSLGAVDARH
ncbi:response regulator [Pseudomonas shirazensis]|uniref:response regulator n=1 Tax=Pseudomonas shirazensis TaxID=2745494 RepID=UPI003D2DA78B